MKLKKVFQSKVVLYIVLFVAIIHVIGYLGAKDLQTLSFFIATGVLSTYFSRNILINLLTAIVATNLFHIGNGNREGMVGGPDDEDDEDENDDDDEDNEDSVAMKKKKPKKKEDKEAYTQKNIRISSPASLTAEKEKDGHVGKRIDYAATLEQAYDNLQNMLGSDGMKGLAGETRNLVEQQKRLVTSLKDIAPALAGAKETMDTLKEGMPNLGKVNEMMAGLTQSLSGKQKNETK
tara:strand:- start:929 stop:1633 length:705 start_codon:yes stop_codon:yes gene_type:complete